VFQRSTLKDLPRVAAVHSWRRCAEVSCWGETNMVDLDFIGAIRLITSASVAAGVVLVSAAFVVRFRGYRVQVWNLYAGSSAPLPGAGGALLAVGAIAAMSLTHGLDRQTLASVTCVAGFAGLGFVRHLLQGWVPQASRRRWLGVYDFMLPLAGFVLAWQVSRLAGVSDLLGPSCIWPAALVIALASQGAFWTDGMDAMATGVLSVISLALAAACLFPTAGRVAEDLRVDMAVTCLAVSGACLAFLRFNHGRARMSVGPCGTLPLGALLGLVAVMTGHVLLLSLAAVAPLVEVASVLLQISWYGTIKRRLLRCAPLHWHLVMSGWPQSRVVRAAWLATIVGSIVGIAVTLLILVWCLSLQLLKDVFAQDRGPDRADRPQACPVIFCGSVSRALVGIRRGPLPESSLWRGTSPCRPLLAPPAVRGTDGPHQIPPGREWAGCRPASQGPPGTEGRRFASGFVSRCIVISQWLPMGTRSRRCRLGL
jgi:phospho-N-acetylmuramoyl-pentapeptide-transferase